MRTQARRLALVAAALLALSALLAACATPSAPTIAPQSGGQINVFRTPNPANASPTPTFPPFTVGAWPSDYSPPNNAHLTIYVLCRIQPPDPSQPPKVAPGIPVEVDFGPPVNQSKTATTGGDGLAPVPFDLNDPQSGTPVTVTITATYNGDQYKAETFFTPNPTAMPTPTPKPGSTPTGTPSASPSPTQ
jgi:hypothetical protein